MRAWGTFPASLILAALLVAPALAADKGGAGTRLDKVQKEIEKGKAEQERLAGQASALENDLKALRQRLVSAAGVVQDRELRVITLEAKIADLVRQEKAKLAQFNANRGQMAGVLIAIQRLVQFPPEALLALPDKPDDLVRSAILLRAAVPEIERRATRLRLDLESLAATREDTARERLNLASAAQNLDSQREEINRLMAEKRKLLERTQAERREAAQRLGRLAGQARDLQDLIAKLDEEQERREREARAQREADSRAAGRAAKAKPPVETALVSPSPSITTRKGRLPLPVVGDLVGRYGENLPTGLTRKGIDIASRPGAQVVATYDGRVAYAGTFRGYGQLLIIDHGDGYHSLLAGMARIDAHSGQRVSTGEPVGQMGSGGDGGRILYVELRRQGQPINPLPWLASRKDKVSG